MPLLQSPFPDVTLIVRFAGDPAAVVPGVRRAVFESAPFDVMTIERSLAEATSRQRFVMSLLTGFGALALTLAVVAVGQRRQEFAVRLALGSKAADLFSLVLRGTLLRTMGGIAAGAAVAAYGSRLLQPLVFETSTRDTGTYEAVAAVLALMAAAGAAIPARKAAKLDPAAALRQD